MSSLADDLDEIMRFPHPYCQVFAAMKEHPDEADLIFEASVSDKPVAPVIRVLAKHGIRIPESSMKRHRRGDCRCRELMPERYSG